MTNSEDQERVTAEIELLKSMYPDEVIFDEHLGDLTFVSQQAKLVIRLPQDYPSSSRPDVVSASTKGTNHVDLRSQMKQSIGSLVVGEEALDSVISSFVELVDKHVEAESNQPVPANGASKDGSADSGSNKTTLIWLHHLLNTNKRKQALAASDPTISGISKPGYPGVLIFSGPQANVDEHVNGLKQLSWAAFQIRLEEDEEWIYQHGHGVKEVESMGDVVKEIGEQRKVTFLETMKMK